jgi:hypothetical protein
MTHHPSKLHSNKGETRVVISTCRGPHEDITKASKKMAGKWSIETQQQRKINGDENASRKGHDTYIIIANPPPLPPPPTAIGGLTKLDPRAVMLSMSLRFHIPASVKMPGTS